MHEDWQQPHTPSPDAPREEAALPHSERVPTIEEIDDLESDFEERVINLTGIFRRSTSEGDSKVVALAQLLKHLNEHRHFFCTVAEKHQDVLVTAHAAAIVQEIDMALIIYQIEAWNLEKWLLQDDTCTRAQEIYVLLADLTPTLPAAVDAYSKALGEELALLSKLERPTARQRDRKGDILRRLEELPPTEPTQVQ